MKIRRLIAQALAASMTIAITPAQAQTFDVFAALPCSDFMKLSRERAALVVSWIDGYYSRYHESRTKVDFAVISRQLQHLRTSCGRRPSRKVFDVVDEIYGK